MHEKYIRYLPIHYYRLLYSANPGQDKSHIIDFEHPNFKYFYVELMPPLNMHFTLNNITHFNSYIRPVNNSVFGYNLSLELENKVYKNIEGHVDIEFKLT